MAALFGHAWASQYGRSPEGVAGETWAAALAGLTGAQLATGLRETMKLGGDFPPSAPRFRMLCLGIPSLEAVRYALRMQQLTPFARLVWSFVDKPALGWATQPDADRMLRGAYGLACEYLLQGGTLPEADPVLLEAPAAPAPITPATEAHVAGVFAELAGHFGTTKA